MRDAGGLGGICGAHAAHPTGVGEGSHEEQAAEEKTGPATA